MPENAPAGMKEVAELVNTLASVVGLVARFTASPEAAEQLVHVLQRMATNPKGTPLQKAVCEQVLASIRVIDAVAEPKGPAPGANIQ